MGCQVHVLEGKMDKIDARSEQCTQIGCPKETKCYLLYSTRDKKVFTSTNAIFLEHSRERESNDKVLLEKMNVSVPNSSTSEIRIEPMINHYFLPTNFMEPISMGGIYNQHLSL